MAKIKYTKNELKTQRDALERFRRFLPTLELKRHQLQTEVQHLETVIGGEKSEETALLNNMAKWIRLFAEDIDFGRYLKVTEIRTRTGNIAGVEIPIFEEVVFQKEPVDFFETPAWLDDGLDALEKLIRLRAEQNVLAEQQRLLSEELMITTQRVNLFEKVKIPEAAENIHIIRIFLGDQDAAGVIRAKIAKNKFAAVTSA